MEYNLSDICTFAREKIDVSALGPQTYISTENMMPDKGGISEASSLPSTPQTQAFRKNDILVSNIRPYFKKIWFATFDGGCSNDVLVFRAKKSINPFFLYYVLSDDTFFEYATATSKGTKMPRGDKVAIMQYKVPKFGYKEQEKISGVLKALDDKIELNNRINENLEQQAQAIFNNTFSDTNRQGKLCDICHFSTEKISVNRLSVQTYFSTENMQPNKSGAVLAAGLPSIAQTTKCHRGDVLVSNIRPYFKKIIYCQNECGCSNDVLCFSPLTAELSAYLYSVLYADAFFDYMVAGSKGTKMPRGDKQQIMNYPIALPTSDNLKNFNSIIMPMLDIIALNRGENKKLTELRDALLPQLLSGSLDVSEVEV